jgi:predicted TIM-barrel fold metal-dependent hydrolase
VSFWYEVMTWTAQVLMAGFFDRYPKVKMAMFECNASWLVQLLEACDRVFDVYRNERLWPAKTRPSEAFAQHCVIGFESDEIDVFRLWDRYEEVGIWASDSPHWDGADAWSAIREMNEVEVPERAQVKLMGANAARMYSIPQKSFVKEEQEIPRPAWFPREEDLKEWWEKETHPRKYGVSQQTSTPRGGY